MGETAREPRCDLRLSPRPLLARPEAHPLEREEAVRAAGAVRPQKVSPPLEDGGVRGQAHLLPQLQRAVCLGELL